VSAPGGQLVQATDLYIGTRHARVVLVDTPDLVRSSITASWLLQLGLDEVYVHAASPQDRAERGAAPIVDVTAGRSVATVTPADLSAKLAAGEPVTVIDLQPPAAYFETRRYLPGSVVARRSTLLSKPEVLPGPVALVSGDGRLARLAAGELADLAGQPVWALDGGVDAWSAAGYPTETGTPPPLTPGDTLPPQPDLESRKAAFAEYVAWGDRIIDQLERDGLVSFREFNEVDSLKPVQVGSARLRALIDHIDAGVVERDQQTRPPFAEFALLKQARIGALRLPAAEGGGDATLTQLFATVIDLAEADPNVAHSLRNHYQFVESLLRRPRASDVRWFDHVRSGRLFGLAATELGNEKAGRRNQQFRTAVTSTTAGLRLSGVKFYSTGNLYADLLVVAAQGPDDEPARIIVPVDRPGVVVERDWDGIGQRFTGSGTTRFDNVPVYQDDFVQPGSSYGDVPYLATFPQLYLTAIIAGILRRVARDAADLVRAKKRTFYHAAADQPTEDPILQQSVGYLASQAYVAEAAVLTAAAALEAASDSRGGPDEADLALRAALRAAKAKVVVDEQAVRAASELFDVGGGTAVRQVSHLDRHWRNIRTLASHNPRTYKAKAVGAYEISGTPLPNGAFF
jgi:alkylation response protein AidB-like acyl-CoA dehydrogenase/rhodanese-related sulfurtransferase